MTLLILGVALWWAAHLFKRVMPGPRARLGDPGKGLVALLLIGSVALMVIGYRGADYVAVWTPPDAFTYINNLLMLFSIYLFAADGMKTRITRAIRHPQLTAFKTWAIAHLIVNGDVPSFILFGGLLAWAVVTVIVLNRTTERPAPRDPAPMGKEIGALVGAVAVFGVIALIHNWLGPYPFG